MRRKWMIAIALAPALMANQCFKLIDVRLAPDAAPSEPPSFSFVFDGEPLSVLERFEVGPCGGGPLSMAWALVPDGVTQHTGMPLRITYGRVPPGYREAFAAQPLAPGGCYRVSAEGIGLAPLGIGWTTFRILPDGRMFEGEPGGMLMSSRPFRQLNRAAVGCARGYRRARTAADRTSVDAREFAVLEARVSCGWLNEHWPDLMRDPIATERGMLTLIGGIAVLSGLIYLGGEIPEPQ